MYKYNDIRSLSLEISSNCQADCPMCARNYHGGLANPLLPIKDIDLEFFKKICPDEFIKQLYNITLCGNFGDPIMNQDLIEIIDHIANTNPFIRIEMDTNGSARSVQWWERLASVLPKNHVVQFGIDGLADTHHIYRINTSFKKIIENATAFIEAGGKAHWNFITFKHNEHQLEDARAMAKKLKFQGFYEKQTSRFIGDPEFAILDKQGATVGVLQQPTEQRIMFIDRKTLANYKQALSSATITCEVEQSNTIHIDAQGHVWPCSFTAGMPYIFAKPEDLVYNFVVDARSNFMNFLTDKFGGIEQLDLRNRSIQEVVNSNAWQTEWNTAFRTNSVHVCTRTCGKFPQHDVSQCRDQFLNLEKFDE